MSSISKKKKPVYKQVKRKRYFEDVKLRMENDVGLYIICIRKDPKFVGFWALVRLLFPIIDAVSSVIYKKAAERKHERLLRHLGIQCPNLTWEMFRHSLIHTEGLRSAIYRGKRINWGISRGGGHKFQRGQITIDMEKLYADLLLFINQEILKSGTRKVNVKNAIHFRNGADAGIKTEFKRLFQPVIERDDG